MKRLTVTLGTLSLVAFSLLPAMAQQQRPRALNGQVTAKPGATSFQMETRGRGGDTTTVTVTVAPETKFGKIETAQATDLTAGYLVVVAGTLADGKVADTQRIVRLAAVKEPKAEDWAAADQLAMAVGRRMGGQRGGGGAGQPPAPPVVGLIASADATTLQLTTQKGEKVQVTLPVVDAAAAGPARIQRFTETKAADFSNVQVPVGVTVVPKGTLEAGATAATAAVVVQMPAFRRPQQ